MLVCDDFYKSATVRPRTSLEFTGSAYYPDVKDALVNGKGVVISDILLCIEEYKTEMQKGIMSLLSELLIEADIEFRYFENEPAACSANILMRGRPERVEKELAFIEEAAPGYHIPEEAITIPVYRQ